MELQKIIDIYYQATGIPIAVFENKNLIMNSEHTIQYYNLPLYIVSSLSDNLPGIWYSSTPEYLYFGGLSYNNFLLLLGPVMVNPCSKKQADQIMHRLGRKISDSQSFRQSMDNLPLIDARRLCSNLILLEKILNDNEIDTVPLCEFKWAKIFPGQKEDITESGERNPAMEDLENEMLAMVKNGKVNELKILFNESPIYHLPEADRATRALNTRKNFIIGANGIASRTATAAGVEITLINSISTNYINEISKSTNLAELSHIFQRLMIQYASAVANINDFPFNGWLEKKVNRYVTSHIYEKISTSVIADALNVTSSYLSSSFKKNTGMSVTDFIKEKKIKEAKYLLDCHSYSIMEISELLCFSTQSYFGSIFKKHTGLTPIEYQEHNS